MMPLDRRITIQRNDGERDDQGVFIDDWQDLASVWARRNNSGSVDSEAAGGIIVLTAQSFLIRYREDLIPLNPAVLRIIDSDGNIWEVESLAESDARRRAISISAVREVT